LQLTGDMIYRDVWADTTQAGVTALADISLTYAGLPAGVLAPVNGIINYPTHIAPIWTATRGAGGADTCTGCHNNPAKLDLSSSPSGTGRVVSYEELLIGDPVIDPVTLLPQIRIEEGVPMIVRGAPLVETMAGNAGGHTRSSRLGEIIFGEKLKAGAEALAAHPDPTGATGVAYHAGLLNAAEKRLVTEWMDLGGQYFNDPFDVAVMKVATLSQATFTAQVLPVLRASCMAGCHLAVGDKTTKAGGSFNNNRFVLTGDPEGDFGATLAMVANTCNVNAPPNYLLTKPSTNPHPAAGTAAVLPVGSAGYTTISAWIASGGC
jgi:hypothetical protein